MEDSTTVVLDIGMHSIKAGFAGKDAPEFVAYNNFGTPEDDSVKP